MPTGQPTYVAHAIQAINAESPGLPPGLTTLYALLALTKGTDTTMRDVHNAWSIWCHGIDPGHRSLIPFEQLATNVRELDRPYMDAIHRAANELQTAEAGA